MPSTPGESAALYVVATPIGHLSDLSARAADVLRSVAWVAAEDTRVTRTLLAHLGAGPRTLPTHEHNELESAARIVALIAGGESVALVTDAGTPGLSDPGARVVQAVHAAGLPVVPIPGPSAAMAMLSVAGIPATRFHFEGFLPTAAGPRRTRLQALSRLDQPSILFEAPHRIERTLGALAEVCPAERPLAIGRELTKRFEEVALITVGAGPDWIAAHPDRRRGEFVLVLGGAPEQEKAMSGEQGSDPERVLTLLLDELSPAQAAKLAARLTGAPRQSLYARALELSGRR